MTPEIIQAVLAHLADESGTRRVFIVEEFERPDARGGACYVTSFTSLAYEARDFAGERELEHEIDRLRANENTTDAAAGSVLIENLRRAWDAEKEAAE